MKFEIHHGDSLRTLPELGAASVDSVVTDPPYELGFMGKAWDGTGIAYSVELWREVLRVLKPGGHLLAFGGTRTYHRMTCAIEDAGFEIRDSLHWMYGTGFPKSLNVSKELDRVAGVEREVIGKKGGRYASPKQDFRGGKHHAANGAMTAMFDEITAPATNAAKQWDGWGTALKPGHEPIVLARKPLEGTVAANVQKWGTGGLNIDGCRIGVPSDDPNKRSADVEHDGSGSMFGIGGRRGDFAPGGRWPANILLDEDAAAELDAQSGTSKSTTGQKNAKRSASVATGKPNQDDRVVGHSDSGGASRFFYVAKPSRKERGETNNHPTVKPVELMRYLIRLVTPRGGLVLDPFMGSGTTGIAAIEEGFRFIGIEQEAAYVTLARSRLGVVGGQRRLFNTL